MTTKVKTFGKRLITVPVNSLLGDRMNSGDGRGECEEVSCTPGVFMARAPASAGYSAPVSERMATKHRRPPWPSCAAWTVGRAGGLWGVLQTASGGCPDAFLRRFFGYTRLPCARCGRSQSLSNLERLGGTLRCEDSSFSAGPSSLHGSGACAGASATTFRRRRPTCDGNLQQSCS